MRQAFLRPLFDGFRLLRSVPGSRAIFFRPELDKFGSRMRAFGGIYRRTALRRTRIVAVIGSLGKTTTARAIAAALDCPDRRFSFSNYGASLAMNLMRVRRDDPYAVLEVGVAGPGFMAAYAQMMRPDIVVATSIASEHNRSFPTLLDTRAEKVKMVRSLPKEGIAVLNGDDPNVRWMASQTRARVLTFGFGAENEVRALGVERCNGSAAIDVLVDGTADRIASRLHGDHMVYPMLAAMAVAYAENLDLRAAISRLQQLPPTPGRMELIALPDGTRILDDSYKAALESVHAAFETAARIDAARKIVVLGSVEEPPGRQGDIYRELGRRLAGFAQLAICIGGEHMSAVRAGAVAAGMDRAAVRLVGSRIGPALELLKEAVRPGDFVLVKGASTQRLRRITLALRDRACSCLLKYCAAKVPSCDVCPLLQAEPGWFDNHFVKRCTQA